MPTVPTPTPAGTPAVVTSWSPPPWATTITTDDGLIEASEALGAVPARPRHADESLTVFVMQRYEISTVADDIAVLRHPAEVLVGGISLTAAEAETLAELLRSAITLIGGNNA